MLRIYIKNLPQRADGRLVADWLQNKGITATAVNVHAGNDRLTSCYAHLDSTIHCADQMPEILQRVIGCDLKGSHLKTWACFAPDVVQRPPPPPPVPPAPKAAKVPPPPPPRPAPKLPAPPPPLSAAEQAEREAKRQARWDMFTVFAEVCVEEFLKKNHRQPPWLSI